MPHRHWATNELAQNSSRMSDALDQNIEWFIVI